MLLSHSASILLANPWHLSTLACLSWTLLHCAVVELQASNNGTENDIATERDPSTAMCVTAALPLLVDS
jgi:hypothetical protein